LQKVGFQQEYQKAWMVAFWYSLDQISAKQPSEEAADGCANHGSHRAAEGPNRGTSGSAARDVADLATRAVNLVKFVVGQQHR
jgi:hypothetical protein